MIEIWKDVNIFSGYQVSNFGNVKSTDRIVKYSDGRKRIHKGKLLKPQINKDGYYVVDLKQSGKRITKYIHQLVCETFLSHTPCGYILVVNHKNFIITDNNINNLEIVPCRVNSNRKHIPHSSKYTGVCWHKKRKKWVSQIDINGERFYLGGFDTQIEASFAYENKLNSVVNHV